MNHITRNYTTLNELNDKKTRVIQKNKRISDNLHLNILVLIVLILFSFLLLDLIFNDLLIASMKKTFTPRIYVQEEYEDTMDIDVRKKSSNWKTRISPGLSMNFESPQNRMNLDYEVGLFFYHDVSYKDHDDSTRDKTQQKGSALWEKQWSPHLRLNLNDTFTRSEERLLESDGQIEEILKKRQIYNYNYGRANLGKN